MTRDSSGRRVLGQVFKHFAVLGGVFADSPARAKLQYTQGSFLAYFGCAFCKLMGTMCGRVVRYLGYCRPVLTTAGAGQGNSFQMGRSDGRLLKRVEQRAQALAAALNKARGFKPPPGNRFKGLSLILRDLYWVHPTRLWVVPFCHAFYLGVFKGWLNRVFEKEERKGAQVCCNSSDSAPAHGFCDVVYAVGAVTPTCWCLHVKMPAHCMQ